MIEWLVISGLSNALVVSVMALLIAITARFARSSALEHVLWLVVFVKLVTPPWFDLALPIASIEPESHANARSENDGLLALDDTRFAPAERVEATIARLAEADVASATPLNDGKPNPTRSAAFSNAKDRLRISATGYHGAIIGAAAVWAISSMSMMALLSFRIRRFRMLLDRVGNQADFDAEVAQLARHIGLKSAPAVTVCEARVMPAVFAAAGRAVLVLPRTLLATLNDEERSTLVAHELAHVRRRDHWVQSFSSLVVCLYWWHPVVWWARRQLHQAAEECCDGCVLTWFPEKNLAYAEAMIKALDFSALGAKPVSDLAPGFGHPKSLERRFQMVLNKSHNHRLSRRGCVIAAAAITVALFVSPWLDIVQADSPRVADSKAKAEQPKTAGKVTRDAKENADAADTTLAAIRAAWQRQLERTQTVRLVWTETTWIDPTRIAVNSREVENQLPKTGAIKRQRRFDVLLDGRRARIRETPVTDVALTSEDVRVAVFDGEVMRSWSNTPKKEHPEGLISSSPIPSPRLTTFKPLLFAYRLLDPVVGPVRVDEPAVVSEPRMWKGQSYNVLTIKNTRRNRETQLWLRRDFHVARVDILKSDRPSARYELNYDPRRLDRPVLTGWRFERFDDDGQVEIVQSGTVKQCDLKPKIEETDFALEFPRGTRGFNMRTRKSFVVR